MLAGEGQDVREIDRIFSMGGIVSKPAVAAQPTLEDVFISLAMEKNKE